MFYYTFAALFAQLAITLRLVTPSGHLAPTAYHTPRVYAMTGKNRWIASCLYFMSFVQAVFGLANSVYDALRSGMISASSFEAKFKTQISEAAEFPDLPLEEYQICHPRIWTSGGMIYVTLSLVYGTFFPLSVAHTPHPITSRSRRLGLAYHRIFRETWRSCPTRRYAESF